MRSHLALRAGLAACLTLLPACTKEGGAPTAGEKAGEAGKGDGAPRDKNGKKGGGGKGGGKREAGPVAVRVATATRQVLPASISVVESLTGRQQAEVFPKVVGRLSFIGPDEGQPVRAGEVLFKVDRADPGESFLSTPVVSPITGWVGRWYATSLGEQVTTTAPVVSVVDDEVLRAVVDLPTREWLLVSKETNVTVAVGGEQRPGKVVTVSRAGDADSGRGGATVEVANPGRTWRAGMVARITLALEPKPRIVVPSSALTITDQGAFVYVIKDDHAMRTPVSYTLIDADSVEITKGLEDGDRIVVAGANMLSDKSAVSIVAPAEPVTPPQGS